MSGEEIKVGDYGTAYNEHEFRCAVKITENNYPNLVGDMLSCPGTAITFTAAEFIPRGVVGGMMMLDQQIKSYEEFLKVEKADDGN